MADRSTQEAMEYLQEYYEGFDKDAAVADLLCLVSDQTLVRHAAFVKLSSALADFPEAYDAVCDQLSDMRFL